MPYDDIKYLELECPEGYGQANLTLHLKEHPSGRSLGTDKIVILQSECDIQDLLLKQDKNCIWSCKDTDEYQSFKKAVEK